MLPKAILPVSSSTRAGVMRAAFAAAAFNSAIRAATLG